MAKYLVPANFTEKTVNSSAMLQVGGGVAPGVYTRTRRNMLTSPNLIRRLNAAGAAMKAQCSQPDACTSRSGSTAHRRKRMRNAHSPICLREKQDRTGVINPFLSLTKFLSDKFFYF